MLQRMRTWAVPALSAAVVATAVGVHMYRRSCSRVATRAGQADLYVTLSRLLAKDAIENHRQYPPHGFSNHLPMALIALSHMGATADRLQQYSDSYTKRNLVPKPKAREGEVITRENWRTFLGEYSVPERFTEYENFFAAELVRQGLAGVIRDYLPHLMRGCSVALYHAMLTLAYGFEGHDSNVITSGLAYLAWGWRPPRPPPAPAKDEHANTKSVREALLMLQRDPDVRNLSEPGGGRAEDSKMGTALNMPQIDAAVRQLRIPKGDAGVEAVLGDIQDVFIAIYLSQPDILRLHCCTSSYSMRHILSALPMEEREAVLRSFFSALCASYAAAKCPSLDAGRDKPALGGDWTEILARACADDDEHVIKMTYACWRESQIKDTGLHRRAAMHNVEME